MTLREMNIQEDILTMDKMLLASGRLGMGGIRIQISPLIQPVARIQLRHNFKWCSEPCRSEMNHWLKDTFGTKEVCYMLNGNTIVVSPEQAAALKLEV